jgi:hypothetical protein
MVSPDPDDDLSPLDPQSSENQNLQKLLIKGSPKRKMGNPSNMYSRAKNEAISESILEGNDNFEPEEL